MIEYLPSSEQVSFFTNQTLAEFDTLIKAPLTNPDMIWIITPLVVTFLVMTVYFGVYRAEELGWNSALGNSIVLLFIVIDLMRHIFGYTDPGSWLNFIDHPLKSAVLLAIIIESFLLFMIISTHALPRKLMFFITSPTSINSQAYVLVAIVYSQIEPSWYLLSAGLLLFIILLLIAGIIHLFQFIFMAKEHRELVKEAKKLRSEAGALRANAKKASKGKGKRLLRKAEKKEEKAGAKEKEVREEEQERFGRLLPFSRKRLDE